MVTYKYLLMKMKTLFFPRRLLEKELKYYESFICHMREQETISM